MDALVFDTSALLNFGHRGDLAMLLRKLAGEYRILTTHGAHAELTDPKRKPFYDAFIREHYTVHTASSPVFKLETLTRLNRVIDSGEISVMTLAAEVKGIAVLDDRAARREAGLLDLRIIGTIGLLHLGLQRKWLAESECLARVVRLCDAGFAISRPKSGQSFVEYFHLFDSSR